MKRMVQLNMLPIDMLHFFLNIALALGIDHDTLVSLYVTKNKENFARQDRGY